MNNNTQTTALGYTRISDKKQINGESISNQKKAIQAYADANNIKIIAWFYDEAKSGKNTDREELQKMLKLATKYKGKIDYVIVYKMNRASRDLESYIVGMRSVLASKGIKIRSVTEQFDDSPMGHFIENMHVMVAQLDNENKRGTVVDNMRSIAMQGYWQHGPVIGFDSVKIKNSEGKTRPSLKGNEMGKKVTAVLLRFDRGDMRLAELTRYAADEVKLRSVNGQKLAQEAISRLVKRPENAGYVHDAYTNYELVEGKHEGLITKDVYWHNQQLLSRKANLALKGLGHSTMNPMYPLRKFIHCKHCGLVLTSSNPNNSPRYFCRDCRGVPSMMTRTAHAKFIELLQTIQPKPSTIKLYKEILLRHSVKELGNINKDVADLRRKLDALSEERTTVLRKYTMDKLDEASKDNLLDTLDSEKFELNNQLLELEERQTLKETNIEYALNFMGNIAKMWGDAPLDLKIKFQNLVFPKGLVLDTKNELFITSEISPLYRYAPTEKGSNYAENSLMVSSVSLRWNFIYSSIEKLHLRLEDIGCFSDNAIDIVSEKDLEA